MKWVEAPPPARRSIDWDAIASSLRQRPGQWALVLTAPTRTKPSGVSSLERGAFEISTRKNASGQFDLYMRYLGDPGTKTGTATIKKKKRK